MSWTVIRVLRERNAGLYLSGVVTSAFGDSAMSLAAGVWAKTLTGSDSLAALVTFCFWLPALTGPAVGVLADRFRRRPLLVVTNLVLAAVLTVPLAVHSREQVWLLFAVLFLVGAGAVLSDAAETALCADVVPEDLRGDLNGLARTAVESGKLCAPLAGAGLFAAFGGHAVALLDCVTFVLAAGAFTLIRVREAAPAAGPPTASPPLRNWTTEMAEGIRALWQRRVLRPLVCAGTAALTVSSLTSTATYALLDSGLHRPPAYAGVLTAAQGLGSLVVGLAAGALLRRMPERGFAAAGFAAFALGSLARATPWWPVVVAGSVLIGAGLPCPLVAALTAVQREAPGGMMGRIAATANTLMFAPTGVALLLGTAMVAVLDYRVQVLAAGALAVGVVVALLLPARGRREAAGVCRAVQGAVGPADDRGGARAAN